MKNLKTLTLTAVAVTILTSSVFAQTGQSRRRGTTVVEDIQVMMQGTESVWDDTDIVHVLAERYGVSIDDIIIGLSPTSGDADDRPTEEVAFYYNR